MFSSKIIKIEDDDDQKGLVRNFYLQQFPGEEEILDENERAQQKQHMVKTTIDAAKIDAERLRVQAQQKAKQTIEKARKQAQQIEKDAFQKGHTEGVASGMAKGEQEFKSKIEFLAGLSAEFAKIKDAFYADHQEIILDLAMKIARKVIHQEVTSNRELIVSVLQSAITLAVEREKLKIRVNPADLEMCLARRPDILKNVDGVKQIVFEPDESIEPGGAVIEYAFGEIDARIEQQLAEVEDEINRARAESDE